MQKVKDLSAKTDATAAELKAAAEALMQASMKLGEAIYKASQASGATSADNTSNNHNNDNSSEKVVDAEYEEVKDDKKNS